MRPAARSDSPHASGSFRDGNRSSKGRHHCPSLRTNSHRPYIPKSTNCGRGSLLGPNKRGTFRNGSSPGTTPAFPGVSEFLTYGFWCYMNLILLAPRLVHHAREVEPRVGEGAWAEPEPWAAGLRKRAEAPSSPTFPAPTGSKARSSAKVPRWSGGAWENHPKMMVEPRRAYLTLQSRSQGKNRPTQTRRET